MKNSYIIIAVLLVLAFGTYFYFEKKKKEELPGEEEENNNQNNTSDVSELVKKLQIEINKLLPSVAKIKVDGIFGRKTLALYRAVIALDGDHSYMIGLFNQIKN